MPLSKGYLRPKHLINKTWLVTGILLGTVYSYVLYAFFYLSREIFRVMTGMFSSHLLLELSPQENFWYNLFYGSIAAIMGFYVCIKFVAENSISYSDKKLKHRQRHLLNEQGFFGWHFMNIFARITSVIGIYFLSFLLQFELEFMYDFSLSLILIPIALFLQPWLTIIKTTGKKGYQWMFYTFLYIATLSLIYAFTNFIAYRQVNENVKKSQQDMAYYIQVPLSKSYDKNIERLSLAVDMYVNMDTGQNSMPVIWVDRRTRLNIEEIPEFITFEKDKVSLYERDNLLVNLHIDKDIPLKFVNDLKQALRKAGVNKIQFSTGVKYSGYPSYYPGFKYLGISQGQFPYYPEFETFLDSAETLDLTKYKIRLSESAMYRVGQLKQYNRIKLTVTPSEVLLNNQLITDIQLEPLLYKFVKKYASNYVIIYEPDENITYDRYIHYLDMLHYPVQMLRNEMSQTLSQTTFNSHDDRYFHRDTIKITYPKHILEWTEEERRLIRLMKGDPH